MTAFIYYFGAIAFSLSVARGVMAFIDYLEKGKRNEKL